jgi:Zn-dependent peptidase ImmA (M78 family)
MFLLNLATEIDDSVKARAVRLILAKEPERALQLLASLYNVKNPKLRVGTVKGRRKTALAVYVHKDNTIYASNSDMLYNPFVILHEFYHHIRSKSGEHRGTEKNADAFASEFIKSYLHVHK